MLRVNEGKAHHHTVILCTVHLTHSRNNMLTVELYHIHGLLSVVAHHLHVNPDISIIIISHDLNTMFVFAVVLL